MLKKLCKICGARDLWWWECHQTHTPVSASAAQTLTALTASPISGGLHQSCVAAPHLFNGIIDHLMSWLQSDWPAVCWWHHPSEHSWLEVLVQLTWKLGPQVGWTRTKFLHVGDGPDPPSLQLGDEIVEPFQEFCISRPHGGRYGVGDLKPEMNCRRAPAASALQSLWKPLCQYWITSRICGVR